MVYQTGFRPAGSLLGANVMLSPTFPTFIQSYPTPIYPASTVYPEYPVITPEAPPVTVQPSAPTGPSMGQTVTWLIAGGIALGGVALLISAVSPKR